jgi:hypothetical protein
MAALRSQIDNSVALKGDLRFSAIPKRTLFLRFLLLLAVFAPLREAPLLEMSDKGAK